MVTSFWFYLFSTRVLKSFSLTLKSTNQLLTFETKTLLWSLFSSHTLNHQSFTKAPTTQSIGCLWCPPISIVSLTVLPILPSKPVLFSRGWVLSLNAQCLKILDLKYFFWEEGPWSPRVEIMNFSHSTLHMQWNMCKCKHWVMCKDKQETNNLLTSTLKMSH